MRFVWFALVLAVALMLPAVTSAMHIMEGFLPKEHSLWWAVATLPIVVIGIRQINSMIRENPERKMLLGLAAAFVFVLSALKIPSVTGSSSHATGIGLSSILFGPAVSSVLTAIVLLFQALLIAHGGLTTWGANTFSMGVAGAFVGWGIFHLTLRLGISERVAVFLAAMLSDWCTYLVTAAQLALAFPDAVGGIGAAYIKFLGVFAVTQLPLAVSEGLLSVVVYNSLIHYGKQGIIPLWWKNG